MKRVRAFFARSGFERGHLVRAVVGVSAVRLGMWVLPFRTVARAVLGVPRRVSPSDPAERDTISWAVKRANRVVPGRGACLHEALAVHMILRRRGFSPELRIGVRRDEKGDFRAHAWVEEAGDVVIGGTRDELATFIELDGFERTATTR